jgi:hypothetical protein
MGLLDLDIPQPPIAPEDQIEPGIIHFTGENLEIQQGITPPKLLRNSSDEGMGQNILNMAGAHVQRHFRATASLLLPLECSRQSPLRNSLYGI